MTVKELLIIALNTRLPVDIAEPRKPLFKQAYITTLKRYVMHNKHSSFIHTLYYSSLLIVIHFTDTKENVGSINSCHFRMSPWGKNLSVVIQYFIQRGSTYN